MIAPRPAYAHPVQDDPGDIPTPPSAPPEAPPTATDADGAQDADWIPERLGPYAIVRLLGYGGMGLVYEARRDDLSQPVALKVVRQGSVDPRAVRRFRRESAVLETLDHPNIAGLIEAGVYRDATGPIPYYALEYVPGAKLITTHADAARLDDHARCALIERVCDALHHAHTLGVVHRDLKPSNVLVGDDGTPKVIDFGVARAAGAELGLSSMHTGSGAIIGTLQYMAPEQIDAERGKVGPSADVYALGAILYQLLCRRLPLHFGDRPYHQAAWMLCTHAHTPPRDIRPDLDEPIARVLDTALAKRPDDRYPTAEALGREIERWRRGLPTVGVRVRTLRVPDPDRRRPERTPTPVPPPDANPVTADTSTNSTRLGAYELGWPELLGAGWVLLDRLDRHGLATGLARLSLSARLEPAERCLLAGGPAVLTQDRAIAVEIARVVSEMGQRAGRFDVRLVRSPGEREAVRVRLTAFQEAQRWLADAGQVAAWSCELTTDAPELTLPRDDDVWARWARSGATHLSVSVGQREGRSVGERSVVVPLSVSRWNGTKLTFEVGPERVRLVTRCRSGTLRSLARERS